ISFFRVIGGGNSTSGGIGLSSMLGDLCSPVSKKRKFVQDGNIEHDPEQRETVEMLSSKLAEAQKTILE
ncbi:hypothetical protein PENTCL1PPCAC_29128, partial [Pristionchus entomophagus]